MRDQALLERGCRRDVVAAQETQIADWMAQIHADWSRGDDGRSIVRRFGFKNYYETIAFVNALAWVAHRQDHHPDLQVGYNRCTVTFSTHSVGGLSENDFICAARVDALTADR
jgi:4a-hydroxytetrahydrobiopterin dehydratase